MFFNIISSLVGFLAIIPAWFRFWPNAMPPQSNQMPSVSKDVIQLCDAHDAVTVTLASQTKSGLPPNLFQVLGLDPEAQRALFGPTMDRYTQQLAHEAILRAWRGKAGEEKDEEEKASPYLVTINRAGAALDNTEVRFEIYHEILPAVFKTSYKCKADDEVCKEKSWAKAMSAYCKGKGFQSRVTG